jgi:hypothetical protein
MNIYCCQDQTLDETFTGQESLVTHELDDVALFIETCRLVWNIVLFLLYW